MRSHFLMGYEADWLWGADMLDPIAKLMPSYRPDLGLARLQLRDGQLVAGTPLVQGP